MPVTIVQEGIPAEQIAKWERQAADLRDQIEQAHEKLIKIEEILRAVALVRNALQGKPAQVVIPTERQPVTKTIMSALRSAPNGRLTRIELRNAINSRTPSTPIKHNAFFTTLNRLKKRGMIRTTAEHVVLLEDSR